MHCNPIWNAVCMLPCWFYHVFQAKFSWKQLKSKARILIPALKYNCKLSDHLPQWRIKQNHSSIRLFSKRQAGKEVPGCISDLLIQPTHIQQGKMTCTTGLKKGLSLLRRVSCNLRYNFQSQHPFMWTLATNSCPWKSPWPAHL